jgi:hypothetical protein
MKGTKFVMLNKNGNVTNKKFAFDGNIEDLLIKVTRMKMPCKPIKLYSYIFNSFRIDIWGFIEGKAGQENTHDLPPNAKCYHTEYMKSDTDLLFGDVFALKYKGSEPIDFEIDEYAEIYTKLFGGFEDLGDTDSESGEDEEPTQEDLDFIVDDLSELSTDSEWVIEDDPKESDEEFDEEFDEESDEELECDLKDDE